MDFSFDREPSFRDQVLQMKREQRREEAKRNRDVRRDRIQKEKEDLFNGNRKKITESNTKTLPVANPAKDNVKIHKKDQKRPNNGNAGGGGGGSGDGGSGGDDYDDTELRNRITELENRLNNASIDAECSTSGSVIVTLTI